VNDDEVICRSGSQVANAGIFLALSPLEVNPFWCPKMSIIKMQLTFAPRLGQELKLNKKERRSSAGDNDANCAGL